MEQEAFLEEQVFTNLTNLNDGFDKENSHYFSVTDFEVVLDKAAHFGIAIYQIQTYLKGEKQKPIFHTDFKKKATDPKWFQKAFKTLKTAQPELLFSATYKVSAKLLAR